MEVYIEKLDHQGRGIAHIDGKIVFVECALPDEVVEIEILKEKKNYSEAKISKLIKKSKYRVDSVCPYFEICGGCDLIHLDYNEQLKYKENKVKEIIKKYGDLSENKVANIVPSPKKFNYRNKITLKNNGKIGYHKKGTNEVINIDKCLLANDSINTTIFELSKKQIDKEISEIVIRDINQSDKSLMLTLQNGINSEKIRETYQKFCKKTICVDEKSKYKIRYKSNIIGKIGDKKFEISPVAFFQVNTEQTVNLYNYILEEIKKHDFPNVLDLYCGTGTIGIYISDYARHVIGVEINPVSVENAEINKKLNNVNNIEFMVGDTKKVLNGANFAADIIIVDPPRAGLEREVVDDLIKLNSKEIIYVSCDPVTLARDLKLLKEFYEVEIIIPFDMFPNTYHVENFCILKRK